MKTVSLKNRKDNCLYRLSRTHKHTTELGKVTTSCYAYTTDSATVDIYNTHPTQPYDYRLILSLEYLESLIRAIKESREGNL